MLCGVHVCMLGMAIQPRPVCALMYRIHCILNPGDFSQMSTADQSSGSKVCCGEADTMTLLQELEGICPLVLYVPGNVSLHFPLMSSDDLVAVSQGCIGALPSLCGVCARRMYWHE